MLSENDEIYEIIDLMGNQLKCRSCHDVLDNPYTLPCQHHLCYECVELESAKVNAICPLLSCSQPFFRNKTKEKSCIS